jgi:lipopolysaccharide transport system ATP-binding protein
MSSNIIRVENLSKQFIISHEKQERYTALRDVISNRAKKIFSINGKAKGRGEKNEKEVFWALKDINFDIKQGERVGIIGRNGAGKSTLLKILSRITEPSSGRITIKGKVASLLEVGTGFHPELTGRENIFLNGAILGMSRSEIRKKFDEIVAFAEVEYFLDTPVKRYSSGMFVRLAFSVAAHLEPEILIVDEVLAVGDAQFQKKCLGKMEDVSKNDGRTVLFVSHNMAAVKSICTSSIILHKGEKILQGNVYDSLAKYISFDQSELDKQRKFIRDRAPEGKAVFIQEADLIDDQNLDYFCLNLKLKIQSRVKLRLSVNIRIKDALGFPIAAGFTHGFAPDLQAITAGENNLEITSIPLTLATGTYKVSIELVIPGTEHLDIAEDCIQFDLSNDGIAKRDYGIDQSWGMGSSEIKFKSVNQL